MKNKKLLISALMGATFAINSFNLYDNFKEEKVLDSLDSLGTDNPVLFEKYYYFEEGNLFLNELKVSRDRDSLLYARENMYVAYVSLGLIGLLPFASKLLYDRKKRKSVDELIASTAGGLDENF